MLGHKLYYKKKLYFVRRIVFIYNTGYSSKNGKTFSALNKQGIRFDSVHWT